LLSITILIFVPGGEIPSFPKISSYKQGVLCDCDGIG
jgi:hypothetical protein